jgi:hypothetical protein
VDPSSPPVLLPLSSPLSSAAKLGLGREHADDDSASRAANPMRDRKAIRR